ncbi:PREDICTED: tripartite motif-containing protein 35 [Myotis brandtii]|uniref:tripartite motif-containing protein 35 n=1 Tax=Myotis brandtii TaxID=109478 RepID=UPI000703F5F3|nr:PREDICTED: tripartite motif-containing protein 35 [Myotis brandtii]
MESEPSLSPTLSRSIKEELLCAVCYDPFRDAVTLRCGHNFCRECVTRCWEVQTTPTCPVCKDRVAPADLRTNHTLNNLVEKLLREDTEGGPRVWIKLRKPGAGHPQAKCRNMEHSLREKAKAFWAMRRSYEAIAKHNQVEATWLERRIRQEFEKLREFLRGEEQAILDVMAEEARQKQHLVEEKMKQLKKDTETLAHEIERLQMEMKEDDISFLMKHKSRKRRLFCTMEPEPVQPGMLINVCKYLDSLQYRVWKKMVMSVETVPFSFDPNTAAGWLAVSEDLTSVTNHGYRVQVENPERFSSAPCLLGSRSFSHGSHAWEVDLGGLPSWRVGVVRMCLETGPEGYSHSCYQDTRSGFWYLCRTQGVEGDHCVTSDPATSPLVPSIPRRLRVELECEEGELSFYDAERQCHLYTFHARFGEVRPYFYLGGTRGNGPPEPLRICPLRITVKKELDT